MFSKNNLPYIKLKQEKEEKKVAYFLLRKFLPKIRKKFPYHYLIQSIPYKRIEFIKYQSKKYRYFLRFDISIYYPRINHKILLKELVKNYKKLTNKKISRNFKKS